MTTTQKRLVESIHTTDLLIDGQTVAAQDARRYEIHSPATGEVVGSVASAGVVDVDLAVAAARKAFVIWSRRTAYDREKLTRQATAHVRTQANIIGRLMALEQGKPMAQCISEVIGGCDTLDYYAAEGVRVEGYSNPTEAENLRSWVSYHPVGVCGLIVPWNYPVSLLSWKLGPALAAGCTVVVKPSPVTPMSSAAFCAALAVGGFPAGVVNVITGPGGELGEALVRHPHIAKIAMTGSTATGKKILAAAAPQLKKVTLELGGQCPAIVCADADLDLAAKTIAYKGFRNMGQACSAVNRVYVDRKIHDALAEKLTAAARKLTIGDGITDPKVDLGPMATVEVLDRVKAHVADAVARGATVLCGGAAPSDPEFSRGNYYLPTVLSRVSCESIVLHDETFGPVVPIVAFDDLSDAINQANDTPYGLAAFLFTRDMATTMRVSESLDAGTICVNHGAVNTNYGPYAGWKDSGYGLELSRRAIYEYLKPKHIKVHLQIDSRFCEMIMLLDPLQSRQLFADALKRHYAVLAVNADSPAAITDCLEAARLENAPIIIETSLWQLTGHSFGAGDAVLGVARYIVQLAVMANSERYRNIPVIFHTDHIKGPDTARILTAAIQGIAAVIGGEKVLLSASTVSLDSSELTEDQNVGLVSQLCAAAVSSNRPATLEVEAGVDDGVTSLDVAERLLTRIEQQHPGYVWLWAPGLGSKHGFSDSGFPQFRPAAAGDHRELVSRLLGRQVGIALHGSSGLSEESLREAVAAGVCKANWSSESLLLRSHAARDFFASHADELDKRHPKFKATAMDNGLQAYISTAYVPAVRERIRLLGGSNSANYAL